MSKRRRYTDEYKREAVRLTAKLGNLSAAARDLGISASRLRLWRDDLAGEEVVAPGSIPLELEVKQLRKELWSLREDRDILKKALAIFSGKPQ